MDERAVLRCKLLQNPCSAVGGVVVNNNHVVGERCLLSQGRTDGVADRLSPVIDGDYHRGLNAEFLFVEVRCFIGRGINQSPHLSQMMGDDLLHLYLYFAVARVHIVELPFTARPMVLLANGVERLVEMI